MIDRLRGPGLAASICWRGTLGLAAALWLTSSLALGQSPPAIAAPPALAVENFDRAFLGVWEPLEAGAVLCRATDPAAVWYNPAGIVLTDRSIISANAPGYEYTTFSGSGFDSPAHGENLRGLPSFVGFVLGREVIPWRDLRIGFGLTNPISWRQGLTVATAPSADTRSSYTVGSEVESFQATVALGYGPLPHFRLGLSIGFSYDTISSSAQIASEATTSTQWQGSLSSSLISANTEQFLAAFGLQYDITPWLSVGGLIRAPALRMFGSASITIDSIASTTASEQLHFQDSSARFELRQPLQVSAGASARTGPLEFELDVTWHQASGAYDLFTSSQPVRLVTTPAGGAPVVTNTPFPDVVSETRAILNTSIGGNLSLGKVWTLHSGVYINQAVTYPSDPFFLPINFYGFRAGASLQGKNLYGSFGLGYEVGTSQSAVGIGSPPGIPPPDTAGRLTIRTLSLLLALGYRF